MNEYTPKIIEDANIVYIEMLIEGKRCHTCKKVMIHKCARGVFPNYLRINQAAQMESAGMVYNSYTEVDGKKICIECKESDKADFKCSLCEQRYPTSEIQEQFGDPPEYLCKSCYATVPAKTWEESCEKLLNEHRYDFE